MSSSDYIVHQWGNCLQSLPEDKPSQKSSSSEKCHSFASTKHFRGKKFLGGVERNTKGIHSFFSKASSNSFLEALSLLLLLPGTADNAYRATEAKQSVLGFLTPLSLKKKEKIFHFFRELTLSSVLLLLPKRNFGTICHFGGFCLKRRGTKRHHLLVVDDQPTVLFLFFFRINLLFSSLLLLAYLLF